MNDPCSVHSKALSLQGRQGIMCKLLRVVQVASAVGGQPPGKVAREGVLGQVWCLSLAWRL